MSVCVVRVVDGVRVCWEECGRQVLTDAFNHVFGQVTSAYPRVSPAHELLLGETDVSWPSFVLRQIRSQTVSGERKPVSRE